MKENNKSLREIINDWDSEAQAAYQDSEEYAIQKLRDLGFPTNYDDEDYIEQRVFLKEQANISEDNQWKKSYDPYEQDLFNFPDSIFNDKVSKFMVKILSITNKQKPGSLLKTNKLLNLEKIEQNLQEMILGIINMIYDQTFLN